MTGVRHGPRHRIRPEPGRKARHPGPREAWRGGKRIHRRTVANLPGLPPHVVEGFRAVPGGAVAVSDVGDLMRAGRSLPHGHVAAVPGTARDPGPGRMLHRTRSRRRDLALAAVAARVLWPDPGPATARRLSPETATGSPGALPGLGPVAGNGVPGMPGWLLKRQPWIGRSLANRHLRGGNTLILHDVSGLYLEGTHCPPAAFGHSRDARRGKRRTVFGLLCAADGCPVAVEVFPGNTADPSTVARQVDRIRGRFGIGRVALVGDRGMTATARIRGDLQPAGLDWIPALKTGDIRRLLRAGPNGPAPPVPEAPVPDAVAEVTCPDFPAGRLVVCPSPRLRRERHRRRKDPLRATEEAPHRIAASVRPGRLKGRAAIDRRVGRDVNRRRVGRHLEAGVTDGGVSWRRRKDRIAAGARPGGVHVIRTSLGPEAMGTEAAVEAYRSPAGGGRAFRNDRTDLRIRPVHVHTADHVRAHVFMCMPALHLEWHMRRRLAPMLSGDGDRGAARAQRNSPVEPTRVPERARAKAGTRLADGLPAHSLRTLPAGPATLTPDRLRLPGHGDSQLTAVTTPTPARERAFGLPGVRPDRNVPIRMTGPM